MALGLVLLYHAGVPWFPGGYVGVDVWLGAGRLRAPRPGPRRRMAPRPARRRAGRRSRRPEGCARRRCAGGGDEWRDNALERIEDESPALIITGTQDVKTVVEDGKRLSGKESAKAHQKGYEETMDDLLGTGATVVTLADNPYPPEDIPSCVSGAVRDLDDCAFSEADGYGYEPVSARANAKFDEVGLIDPKPVMCKDGTCPAVIGNVIVYRNGAHITASYMETLTDWLDGQLRRVT